MLSRLDVRLPAALISLLLSFLAAYMAPVINNDGVVYIASAARILQGDWGGAYQLYNWPLYSGFIAFIGNISGLNLELSAQLLNAFFSATLAVAFLTLIRDFGADRKTLWIAAFVILFHPYLNDSRDEIIRDHGYWTLYLVAILYFFRFLRNPGWCNAIVWSSAMGIATLFRIEGVVFLFLLPAILLVTNPAGLLSRAAMFFQASTLALLALALLAILSLLQPDFYTSWAGRLDEPGHRLAMLWNELTSGLQTRASVIRDEVLTPWSDDYALPTVYAAVALMLVSKTIQTLTPLYSVLPLVPKLQNRFNPPAGTFPVLAWLVFLNVAVVVAFLVTEFFISSRYVVPLVLTLLIMVPFALASLHDQWIARRTLTRSWKFSFPLILILLIFMTGDGLIAYKGYNRTYLKDAGNWIQHHLPANARLFTNNDMLRYYSGREIRTRNIPGTKSNFFWLDHQEWKDYRYLAIVVNRHTKPEHVERFRSIDAKVLKTFRNVRDERVLILERPQ